MPIELAQTTPLIDHHCHGITSKDLDYVNFQKFISESYRPPPEGTSDFQKPVGLAVRRFCAPVLGLEKGVSGEDYVRRRQELGPDDVNRRLMRACGLSHLLIDTGHRASIILDVPAMAGVADVPAREVVRIEALAEEIMRAGVAANAFPNVFADTLRIRSRNAVGLKTIVAYRTTFAIDYSPPADAAVSHAGRTMDEACRGFRQVAAGRCHHHSPSALDRGRGLPGTEVSAAVACRRGRCRHPHACLRSHALYALHRGHGQNGTCRSRCCTASHSCARPAGSRRCSAISITMLNSR